MFSDVLDGLLGSKLLNSFRCFRYIPGFVLVDLFGRRRLIGNPEQIMEDREAPAANKGNISIYMYIIYIHFNIAAKFSSKAWINRWFFLLACSSNGWAGTWCPHVYHSNSICCWQLEFWCVCVRMCSFCKMNTFFPPNFALSLISCFDLLPLDQCREDHYIFRPHVLSHRTWIYHKLLGPDLRQLYWVELLLAAASCICAICGCSCDRCNYSFFKPVVKMPTDGVLKRREVRQGSTKAGTSQRQGFDEWHDQKATGWTFLLEIRLYDAKGWKTMQDHVFQNIVNGMCYEQFGRLQFSSKIFWSLFIFLVWSVKKSALHINNIERAYVSGV